MGKLQLDAKFLKEDLFKDPLRLRVFVYLCLNANTRKSKYFEHTIEKGQFITSIAKISDDLNSPPYEVAKCIYYLDEERKGFNFKFLEEDFRDTHCFYSKNKPYCEAIIVGDYRQWDPYKVDDQEEDAI